MSKLSVADMEQLRTTRNDKIIAHAVASVNLFNTTPRAVKFYAENGIYFIKFEVVQQNGAERTMKYFCYSALQQKAVTSALADMYGIDVIEEKL